MKQQERVAALKHLAGLGGVWCMHKQPQPGTGQMTTEMPMFSRPMSHQRSVRGFGASGASAFTMTSAQALNDYLVTNNCAGCNDMTSPLRQLTFAFKAAYLTDTGIQPVMNLNMSTALAMTAYGTATDAALKQVLGASAYQNGPCTDDNGYCLGNVSTPSVPQGATALEQQIVHAIQGAIQKAQFLPQPELVNGLVQGFAALINQIGFELAKVQQPATPPVTPPIVKTSSTSTSTANGAATGWTTGEKVAAGIGAGVVLTGVALLVYNVAKRS